jgi:DNA invertase Pin-like site-specific DNA recombinase
MSPKINPIHLQHDAYVYVRQSTGHQVRSHPESQRRQYALGDHASGLGFARGIVIDEDVGRSGTGRPERLGIGQLLAAVCEGRVGAVFALEASRLARNNRDWHHLIDLCALTETLLIDDDGIYEPRQRNDRLVLGTKGSMAEYELSLLRQRARQACEAKIQRAMSCGKCPWGSSARVTIGSTRSLTAKCTTLLLASSSNFVNWAVPGRPCSGIVMRSCRCLRSVRRPWAGISSGACPVASYQPDAAQSILCWRAGLWPHGSQDRDRRRAGASEPASEKAGGAVAYSAARQSRRVH